MKERPILFSAPMVRALLAGTKTQTRRIVKPDTGSPVIEPYVHWQERTFGSCSTDGTSSIIHCPYGQLGDRLWVKETWRTEELEDGFDGIRFRADDAFQRIENTEAAADRWLEAHKKPSAVGGKWRPSIYMQRWASRLVLEVTGVRVERLNAISEADAIAEGCSGVDPEPKSEGGTLYAWKGRSSAPDPRAHYAALWESINGPGSWAANPWVWAISFKRVTP